MFVASKKTALVTGASSGMGKEIAKRLVRDGYQVYVAARRVESMKDLREMGAQPLRMDISVEGDIVSVVEHILGATGGVDLLVNNAGFGLYGPMEQIPLADARYQFEVNVFGPARLTQLLLPAMRARGRGRIVNITSMGGKIYTPLGSWYHATKHALEGWSDCLRLELEPHGIDVVVIEPGLIETAFGEVVGQGMLQRYATGPYAGLATAVAKGTGQTYGRGRNTHPRVIANVVSRAARAERPRTRYVAGRFGGFLIGFRSWFGDRAFDGLIMSQLPKS